jgi:hypothetical protein
MLAGSGGNLAVAHRNALDTKRARELTASGGVEEVLFWYLYGEKQRLGPPYF